jgi:hypothetical protein
VLWQGCAAGVISELKDLHASGRYTENQNHDIQGAINYLTNQDRMKYPLYWAHGLAIGSGVVVIACKNVVAARMKQSGMMWSLGGAEEMLQLRASVKSSALGDFERLLPASPPEQNEETPAGCVTSNPQPVHFRTT